MTSGRNRISLSPPFFLLYDRKNVERLMKMRITFSYIPTSYWPIDKTEEEQIDVFGVVELTGSISGMKQELQYQVNGRHLLIKYPM
ncbi:hypothetical protein QCI77_28435 [Bacillus cereus group sp. MG9]|uniref:hypothetical protein n=1 Tax=Bacillus cereus group sp. MG9 TaxID=3040247 RepID=UPI0033910467